MTVLDFDPPHSPLRLVSTNGQTPDRDHRYRSAASLYGDARSLYRDVLQAALASNQAINPDALRVVLATKQATTAGPAATFTAAGLWQLLFVDVVSWCRNRQLDTPVGCAEALVTTVGYLHDNDAFGPRSDSLHELFDAIEECTGTRVVHKSLRDLLPELSPQ